MGCQKVGSGSSSKHNTSKNNSTAESALKKLTKTVHAVQTGSGDRTSSPARSNDRKHPVEFNGTNRLNKRLNRGVHLEDEWQSYWDQVEDSNQTYEAEENFTNHLKVSQDKYLPKEDISLDDVVVTEKVTNLTTFAALKKVPCPVSPLQQQYLTS